MKHYEASPRVEINGRLPEVIGIRIRDTLKKLAGQTIHIVIEDPKRYSTNPQRQYYFGVIVVQFQEYFASNGQWFDKDDLHEIMMTEIGHLWKDDTNPFTGGFVRRRRSYNDLSTTEAENYHTLCRAWAAQRGFDIPEPNEERAPRHIDQPALEAPTIEQPRSQVKASFDNDEIPK